MSRRLVFVTGSNAELAAKVTVRDGKVLLNLPNYTLVHSKPVQPEPADVFCYALEVEDDLLNEVCDVPDVPSLRLWAGPKNNRGYSSELVTGFLHCLDNPLAAVDKATVKELKDLKAALKASEDLAAEVRKTADQHHKELMSTKDKLGLAESAVRTQAEEIAALQDQLLMARTSGAMASPDVKTLAAFLRNCSDEVLEALPYIGKKNLGYLRKWIENPVAGKKGD